MNGLKGKGKNTANPGDKQVQDSPADEDPQTPDAPYVFKQDLKQSEVHFMTAFEHAAIGMAIIDPNRNLVEVNRSICNMLGYPRNELILKGFDELTYPGDLHSELEFAAELVRGERQSYQVEKRFLHKSGQIVWILLAVSAIRNGKGDIQHFVWQFEDITLQKQSETNLKAIFENSSEGFILVDTAYVIKAFNHKAIEIVSKNHHTPGELEAGRCFFDFIDESRKASLHEMLSKSLQGEMITYNRSYHQEDDGEVWFNFSINPVKIDGVIVGACISGLDITKQKFAEQEKDFEGNNLRALINNTVNLMWSIDTDFKLITSNQAFDLMVERISGSSLKRGSDVLAAGFSDGMRERWKLYYNRAFSGQTFKVVEYTEPPDENWSEISFYPIRKDNRVIGTACYSHDITAKKKAEVKLKASKERYDVVAKATSDTIWDWDLINDKTQYNEGINKMFGYNLVEIPNIGGWWDEKLHPGDAPEVARVVEAFINSNQSKLQLEYRFKCADGSYKFILDRAFAIRDEQGKAIRMIGAMQDITERTRHINAIEEQNTKLREIAWTQSHVVRAPVARIIGLINLIEDESLEEESSRQILGYILSSALELDAIIKSIVDKTPLVDTGMDS